MHGDLVTWNHADSLVFWATYVDSTDWLESMNRQFDTWFRQFLLSEYFYHTHRSVLTPPLCNLPAMWPRVSGVVADSPLYKEGVCVKIASLILWHFYFQRYNLFIKVSSYDLIYEQVDTLTSTVHIYRRPSPVFLTNGLPEPFLYGASGTAIHGDVTLQCASRCVHSSPKYGCWLVTIS